MGYLEINPNAPASDLTIRQHIATECLKGLLAHHGSDADMADDKGFGPCRLAQEAIDYADGLIEAFRNERPH